MMRSGCSRDSEDLVLVSGVAGPGQAAPVLPPEAMLPRPSPTGPGPPTSPLAKLRVPTTPVARLRMPKSLPAAEPATPRDQTRKQLHPRSPPPAPRNPMSNWSLVRCLEGNDVEEVRAYLAVEPEAVAQYFWDGDFEPSLCCAVRVRCSPDIVRLLLQHGADATLWDKFGNSPLTRLASLPMESCPPTDAFFMQAAPVIKMTVAAVDSTAAALQQTTEVARLLIDAGADPQAFDAKDHSAIALAKGAGNAELARFMEHYHTAQPFNSLVRENSPLTGDELELVMAYVLPPVRKQQLVTFVRHKGEECTLGVACKVEK